MNDTPTAAPIHEDFLTQLRRVAAERMATWCSDTDLPCGLFHATELGGEVGEVLNVVKKLHREAQGWRGSRATVADLAEEIGDVLVCLDKLAAYYGIDLAQAAAAKFNSTSEKVGLPHRLGEAVAPTPVFTFSADAEDNASETQNGGQSVRSGAQDGYATAFYEIAKMLGIGARAKSPFEVWRDEMKPKLEALTAHTDAAGKVDRTALAKLLNEAAGPRRIAGEEDAALFADSKPEVQEYWLEVADAAISAAQPLAKTPGDERLSDEALESFLPEYVRAEKRCGIQRSAWMTSWYVPWSPRNNNENAEGPWSHWVALAHAILKVDAKAIAAAACEGVNNG